jgi:hypothetical protein
MKKHSDNHNTANDGNMLLSAVLIKGLSLGLFGVGIIAGFLQIVKSYDQHLKDDDWSIAYISITWFVYIFAKTYVEMRSVKNCR